MTFLQSMFIYSLSERISDIYPVTDSALSMTCKMKYNVPQNLRTHHLLFSNWSQISILSTNRIPLPVKHLSSPSKRINDIRFVSNPGSLPQNPTDRGYNAFCPHPHSILYRSFIHLYEWKIKKEIYSTKKNWVANDILLMLYGFCHDSGRENWTSYHLFHDWVPLSVPYP